MYILSFFYYQGYFLYRDVNNHSMTVITISPETLEQDGTVILPGMFLLVKFFFLSSSSETCMLGYLNM